VRRNVFGSLFIVMEFAEDVYAFDAERARALANKFVTEKALAALKGRPNESNYLDVITQLHNVEDFLLEKFSRWVWSHEIKLEGREDLIICYDGATPKFSSEDRWSYFIKETLKELEATYQQESRLHYYKLKHDYEAKLINKQLRRTLIVCKLRVIEGPRMLPTCKPGHPVVKRLCERFNNYEEPGYSTDSDMGSDEE